MPAKRRNKHWSYNTGERGRNWVRAHRQARDGRFYLEFMQDGRRRAVALKDVSTEAEAKLRADRLAAKLAESESAQQSRLVTLAEILARYTKEVTPAKGNSKQGHDRRASRLWTTFFRAQPEQERSISRHPSTLDRIDWDRFITQRKAGNIPGWTRPVRDRQVSYDLKYMIAVLNWAVGAGLTESSPWGTEVRRAQRWAMPEEKNPHRPSMTDELREGLIAHAPCWQLGAMLLLERETRRRNSAIRQLRWSDIDLVRETILWRAETDKVGRENVTPLSPKAVEVLKGLPSRGIGDVPVFPGADPSRPTSRHTCQTWLRRAKTRWLEATTDEGKREDLRRRLKGVGFHSEKRAGVRDRKFRRLPPAIQEAVAGTNFGTLRRTYDQVTVEDMRKAMNPADSGPITSTNYEQEG